MYPTKASTSMGTGNLKLIAHRRLRRRDSGQNAVLDVLWVKIRPRPLYRLIPRTRKNYGPILRVRGVLVSSFQNISAHPSYLCTLAHRLPRWDGGCKRVVSQ